MNQPSNESDEFLQYPVKNKLGRAGFWVLVCCLALLVTGCSLRKPHLAATAPDHASAQDYLDLQPGWQVQVITPVLKSGGYKPQLKDASKDGGIAFTTTDDFVGYETSKYEVKRRNGGGIRMKFVSAWVTKQGTTTRRPHPLVPMFDLPDSARLVRLVYLVRVSQADHDMAIVAASDPGQLDRLTESVRTNPAEACRSDLVSMCEWVPQGIGVYTDGKP